MAADVLETEGTSASACSHDTDIVMEYSGFSTRRVNEHCDLLYKLQYNIYDISVKLYKACQWLYFMQVCSNPQCISHQWIVKNLEELAWLIIQTPMDHLSYIDKISWKCIVKDLEELIVSWGISMIDHTNSNGAHHMGQVMELWLSCYLVLL